MVRRETLLPSFYQIGVLSLPVVALTGTFIGIILAVQTYDQFRMMHMESRMGAVINLSLVRELGPVLAATMLAGRVGSAMAAELGTMRVTEQIDALASMGANPIHYLVVPRFLACLLLIPALTIMADFMGIVGGAFYSVYLSHIDWHYYLEHSQHYVRGFDVFAGAFKSVFFGAAIALISCYHGFHCDPGAEGVGRAATTAFVYSFVVILMLDVVLAVGLGWVYLAFWPEGLRLL
jgi:phospholipid/cholesterol/gamma-HCH transport system permease protein